MTCSGVLNGVSQKQLYYDTDLDFKRPYKSNFSFRRHEEARGAVQPHLNATLAILPQPHETAQESRRGPGPDLTHTQ